MFKNIKKAFGLKTDVREFLLRAPRFSSERSKALLVVKSDLDKEDWQQKDIDAMQCQLLRLQQTVQANGKTLFLALPIPDKLSAYHDDLVDSHLPSGVINRLADPRLNRPRVEETIRAAITAGTIDVYLPNDTHFGASGQEATANTVLKFIAERTRKAVGPQTPPAPSP